MANEIIDNKSLVVFQGKNIRRTWFNDEWWFSVVDIIGALTKTDRARKYWSDLKVKLTEEGFEVSEKIGHFKPFTKTNSPMLWINDLQQFYSG